MGWIDHGKSWERQKLNERPVFFRTLLLCVAVAQSIAHLYRDYDSLRLPEHTASNNPETPAASPVEQPFAQMRRSLNSVVLQCVWYTLIPGILGFFAYFLLWRKTALSIAFPIARVFYPLPKHAKASGINDGTDFILRFVFEAFLLNLIWETSNLAFTAFVTQEPLKKGGPLTADSKDPNGSLLAGLKAKKDVPRSMAFWELAVITQRFPDRRKSILQDLDRKGGSSWSQILSLCLNEIGLITKRIQDCQQLPTSMARGDELQAQTQYQQALPTMPRIVQPLQQANIFTNAPPRGSKTATIQADLGALAKSFGQSPGANPTPPAAKKLLTYTSNRLLTDGQRTSLRPTNIQSKVNGYIMMFLRSPFGTPLRQSFARRVTAVVQGTPHSDRSNILFSTQILTTLATCSIHEDKFGQVAKDVPSIIRTMVPTIQSIQIFMQTLPPHWTDVEFDEKGGEGRKVKEVEEVVEGLRAGLEGVLTAFGEYADGLGLSAAEIRVAKELVGAGKEKNKLPEMKQV
ncbi:hypothetical protein LTR66_006977 [Elasticomyces elasticus]|nr:hypothetical protein LTR66_006977 [Elasticomyces elasticus]